MTTLDDELRDQFTVHQVGDRTASAALLAWFLENLWGLDPEAVPDAICDKSGDKGIDGIVVDDDSLEITLFQTKCFDDPDKRQQGDKDIRDFIGAAKWFANARAIEELLASRINKELRNLLERTGMAERLSEGNYTTTLVFVTNGALNQDAEDYVAVCKQVGEPRIEVWGRDRLTSTSST